VEEVARGPSHPQTAVHHNIKFSALFSNLVVERLYLARQQLTDYHCLNPARVLVRLDHVVSVIIGSLTGEEI